MVFFNIGSKTDQTDWMHLIIFSLNLLKAVFQEGLVDRLQELGVAGGQAFCNILCFNPSNVRV